MNNAQSIEKEFGDVISSLRFVPGYRGRDIAPSVMAGVRRMRQRELSVARIRRIAMPVAAAAAAAVVAGLAQLRWAEPARPGAATLADAASAVTIMLDCDVDQADVRREAAEWLMASQQEDGSWKVKDLGGRQQHAPALNALALMALSEQRDPRYGSAIRRGAAALAAMQDPASGRIGAKGDSADYNHALCTLALISVAFEGVYPEFDAVLDKALDYSRATASGGDTFAYGGASASAVGVINARLERIYDMAMGASESARIGNSSDSLKSGLACLSALVGGRPVLDAAYAQVGGDIYTRSMDALR